jgi:glucose/arabinose dehydrogenase
LDQFSDGGRAGLSFLNDDARKLALTLFLALVVGLASVFAYAAGPARGEALVPGFTDTLFADGISSPTAMAFAPDGRLFVAQKTGELRVIRQDGTLLAQPFLKVRPDTRGERGLLGVAFDPEFATNGYVYVYYTAKRPSVHNRVARFTADPTNPDVAQDGNQRHIFDLNALRSQNHNGGAIHFGTDGKLYVAAGENREPENSQSLKNVLGKILRINKNGSIPRDNPYYRKTTGRNKAIWARGFRNPFTFGVNTDTGTIFVNDVGSNKREEINRLVKGDNYGWPRYEGKENDPRFRDPIYAYPHTGPDNSSGCAITGAAFYAPDTDTFGQGYAGDYFFGDLCNGWIHKYDPASGDVTSFAQTPMYGLVDIQVGQDGNLYYLHRNTNSVRRISKS